MFSSVNSIGCDALVSGARSVARPAIQQFGGHLERRLHHIGNVLSCATLPWYIRKESARQDIHVRRTMFHFLLKCYLFLSITRRLTGRPSSSQWPSTLSIARETFPNRTQQLPRDLCPALCEYSNDLLTVSVMRRQLSSSLKCSISLTHRICWPSIHEIVRRRSSVSNTNTSNKNRYNTARQTRRLETANFF